MACELFECCQFFKDNMKELPKTAEYIQERVCFGDYLSCKRYRIYQQLACENLTPCLDADVEAVQKMTQCLRSRKVRLRQAK